VPGYRQEQGLVAPACAPKNEGSLRRPAVASGSTAASRHEHLNIQMDRESAGVPFASQACRRGGGRFAPRVTSRSVVSRLTPERRYEEPAALISQG
jgi:hypothetical protein